MLKNTKPFTQWTGGKRQLLPTLEENMPTQYNHYFEPFVGGGALLFAVTPKEATINDSNHDLMLAYQQIRDNVDEVIELLTQHKQQHDKGGKDYFLYVRSADRDGRIEMMNDAQKAARLLFLLRVDYNALYRVNAKNQFNATYGNPKNAQIVYPDVLRADHDYFVNNHITMLSGDFQEALNGVSKGDFVYLDPPYAPVGKYSKFTSYTANKFLNDDQVRLRDTFVQLDKRGAYVMLSNSNVPLIQELYADYSDTSIVVKANRVINSDSTKRKNSAEELIIKNY